MPHRNPCDTMEAGPRGKVTAANAHIWGGRGSYINNHTMHLKVVEKKNTLDQNWYKKRRHKDHRGN